MADQNLDIIIRMIAQGNGAQVTTQQVTELSRAAAQGNAAAAEALKKLQAVQSTTTESSKALTQSARELNTELHAADPGRIFGSETGRSRRSRQLGLAHAPQLRRVPQIPADHLTLVRAIFQNALRAPLARHAGKTMSREQTHPQDAFAMAFRSYATRSERSVELISRPKARTRLHIPTHLRSVLVYG